jgi:site-specific recombinase XerD
MAGLRVGDLEERRGIPHFLFRGKDGKSRYFPAHPVAVAAVREYLTAADHEKDKDGPLLLRATAATNALEHGADIKFIN